MLHARRTLPGAPLKSHAGCGRRLRDYVLLERMDEGGMGEIWSAEHRLTGAPVALKLSKDHSRAAAARFVREARLTRRAAHPNIICVHELVRSNEGMLGLAMEKLEGAQLAALMASSGALSLAFVARAGAALASALAAVHARGVIHRDIKPSNVFVTRTGDGGSVKLLDFGIARDVARGCVAEIGGTPGYMAPEQATDAHADHRVDVWSLGVLLFEALTGAPLFEGEDLRAIMRATREAPIASLTGWGVPSPIAAIVSTMLERDPERRPALASVHERLALYAGPASMRSDAGTFADAPTEIEHASGWSFTNATGSGFDHFLPFACVCSRMCRAAHLLA